MHNARFRLMASVAGATLCLFAATTAYGQNPTPDNTAPPAGTVTPDAQSTGSPATTPPTASPQTAAPADNGSITTTATDVTTTSSSTRFPFWVIVVAAVVVILLLFGLFRGRDTMVVRETYTAPTVPPNRNVSTGTAVGDRNLAPRTASGTETNSGRMNDPNART